MGAGAPEAEAEAEVVVVVVVGAVVSGAEVEEEVCERKGEGKSMGMT